MIHQTKKQKHPHYEYRTTKLDLKDNEFSIKKFHKVRSVSTHKELIKSFGRIGMCLNDKSKETIPTEELNKVCFIIINDYDKEDKELGVGPLNDGYLISLKHHRLWYKVFYLFNARYEELSPFLSFFMDATKESLTVFYSGRDNNSQGIEFNNGTFPKNSISKLISLNENKKVKIMFITDCLTGGSLFDIENCKNAIAFYVKKNENNDSDDNNEIEKSHGIFTYYFCKIISENPSVTPNRLVERMNPSLSRFNESFTCEFIDSHLGDEPIFY